MTPDSVLVEEQLYINAQNQETSKVEYPETDGEPMGETGFHVIATLFLLDALRYFFRNQPDVYVIADMFLYYEQGNPKACKAPDVMVIKGIDKHERRIFKTWEERAVPCVIFEITSKSTMFEDMINKSILYASLGVREYFLFDPLREYLDEALVGGYLQDKAYVPIQSDDRGFLFSKELGIYLAAEERLLRVIDPHTDAAVPGLDEAMFAVEQEAQRAEQEAQRAEQEAQRAEQEAQRAEQEAQRAEQEAQRAEQERRRAEAAEAELARLRAMIEKNS